MMQRYDFQREMYVLTRTHRSSWLPSTSLPLSRMNSNVPHPWMCILGDGRVELLCFPTAGILGTVLCVHVLLSELMLARHAQRLKEWTLNVKGGHDRK